MSLGGGSGRRAMMSEINVTPMVDVMLVLLVIFMVTAPLLHEGINVALPKADGQKIESPEEDFKLTIRKDGKVFLGKEEVPFDQLKGRLTDIYKTKAEKRVFVEADEGVNYGRVVEVIAEAKAAGAEQLGLKTLPKSLK
ncbi:MAG: biopolymer transporter ExbD [Deltaproteobacteria bacterium]|nr:biopolymer transporter ExbD [Deltaproteobacteria bacterium]